MNEEKINITREVNEEEIHIYNEALQYLNVAEEAWLAGLNPALSH